jgi:hypothetical protein
MVARFILIAAMAGGALAMPGAAQAQAAFHLRNETRQVIGCYLRPEHGSIFDRFVLRPAAEWSGPASGSGARLLQCENGVLPLRARLRPGISYVLTEDSRSGAIVVRIAQGR